LISLALDVQTGLDQLAAQVIERNVDFRADKSSACRF
jgi:hypothetical protein